MRRSAPPDPRSFLPLKPPVLAIMVALAEEPRHGYAIIHAVREASGDTLRLDTGPLYRFLKRLLDDGLVEETAPATPDTDERRRYYQPTPLGLGVIAAETERLNALLARPRRVRAGARSGS